MSDAIVRITSAALSAEINPLGAELWSLRAADGADLLWDGDPQWWTGRAPILFPVVGAVAGGVIRVEGREYPMAKHGFARRRPWARVEQSENAATFRLEDDAETRAAYPFAFRLDLRFSIVGARLELTAALTNTGDKPLPASFGYHPAFRWPLPGGERASHRVRFVQDEAAPIRRIGGDGLLRPAPEPTPVQGNTLVPTDAMFEDDALIFDALGSHRLTYGVPGKTTVDIAFFNLPDLGIWTKPGAPYLCIEPWQGMADPEGFSGDFRDKPGVIETAPGETTRFTLRIGISGDSFG